MQNGTNAGGGAPNICGAGRAASQSLELDANIGAAGISLDAAGLDDEVPSRPNGAGVG